MSGAGVGGAGGDDAAAGGAAGDGAGAAGLVPACAKAAAARPRMAGRHSILRCFILGLSSVFEWSDGERYHGPMLDATSGPKRKTRRRHASASSCPRSARV